MQGISLTHIFSEPEMADGIATSAFFRAWRSAGVTAVSYFYAGVCLMQEEEPAIERLDLRKIYTVRPQVVSQVL